MEAAANKSDLKILKGKNKFSLTALISVRKV